MTTPTSQEEIEREEALNKQYDTVIEWIKIATIKDMTNAIADAHQPKGKEDLEAQEMYPHAFNRVQDAIERMIDVIQGEEEDRAGSPRD